MFKGNFTSGTSVTTNAVITQALNTNNNTSLASDNSVNIYSAGIYDVNVMLNTTYTTGGIVSVQLYANGVAIPESQASETIVAGATHTFNISDVIRVSSASLPNVANISVRVSVAGVTINSGTITIEKRK